MEHHPVRNLQHETSQTTFDEFNQSQHLLHTLLWSIFVFKFCFYLSWINKAFCCSVAKSCPTAIPSTAVHQSFTISEFAQLLSLESVMLSNHLILCCPHFLLLSMFPSIRVFSNESDLCIRWPKYWSFSFSINPSNEYSRLISLSMDWLDLLAVQGTLKSLLQHHSSKASILWHSAFLIVQLSHPYMITGKTTALTRQTFVGKVMSLLLNMLSMFQVSSDSQVLGVRTSLYL